MPLYKRWLEIVDRNASSWALRDGERIWTFQDLQSALDQLPIASAPVVLQGRSAQFVLRTLQAWRDRQVAIPLEDGAEREDPFPAFPKGIVHVKTTSGSTGSPRQVLFTAEQLAADVSQIVRTMGLRAEWPNIGVISLAHSYGFSNLVLPLLLHGIPLVLIQSPLPETMRNALTETEGEQGVTIAAVPAMWRTWHVAGVLCADQIKLGISAGAPLPIRIERAIFESSGLKVHNFLGASECGGIAYDATNSPRAEGSTWIGSAMQGVELATTKSGTLQVCSAAVAQGYWPQQDSTLGKGKFQTTDIVRLENGSDVHLLGRSDDMINVAGRKVHPNEIEALLNSLPDVLHAVVFGIPCQNSLRGEQMVALLSLQDGGEIANIKRGLAEALPEMEWKMPRQWHIEPELRPDARGKLPRAYWKKRFLS